MTDLGGGYQPQGAQPWHPGDPGYGGQEQQPMPEQHQQTGAWQQIPQQQQGQQFGQAQYVQQGYPQQQFVPQDQYAQQPQVQQAQPQFNDQTYGGQQFDAQQQVLQQAQQQGQFAQGGGQYDQFGYPQQQVQQQVQQQTIPQQFVPQGQPGQPGQQFPQQQMPGQQFPQQQMPGQPGQQIPQQQMPRMAQPAPQQPQAPKAPRVPQPAGPGPDGIDWEAEAAALDTPAAAEPAVEEWVEEEHHDGHAEDAGHAVEPDRPSLFGGEEEPETRDSERKRKEKGKQEGRRNRGACLIVAVCLLGATAGAGWWGYGFYQTHFGPPPDYAGDGNGSVNVEIKTGDSGSAMGQALKDADVVKSVGAFVSAVNKNPKGATIQPGTYTLAHQMSAAAAVAKMVDSNGGNALTIPEGKKSVDIYAKIDAKLKLPNGTTANIAKDKVNELGLPDYAHGNIEGFLYPTKYSITDGMKPEDLLKQMVSTAVEHYKALDLDTGAQKIGLKSGYDVITEASILQAEGNNSADFAKMARAIYNRLNTNATGHKLGLDTTLQYQLGRTRMEQKEIDDKSLAYNTYLNPGLPPGPIGNPGDDAIKAVLNPTPGNWVYWIAMSPSETRFASTPAEHASNVKDYCTARGQGFDPVRVTCKS
ncbi:endolytic transglycosylase MltG [Kitasatospora sp. HPMI-4]|uniref:endolytic transglycosylase MltG n=1 Tax=Kitasatospora sp. HPMI-4 TaxID=3448443 RepID=UPI003F1A6E1E